jgi:ABC-type Fe3+/spermidine/putrescine transport system ATPase subunit
MIEVQGLSYSVGAFSLVDVSLQVQDGEYFVVLGPTGSGKTLLLESLSGLNRIDAGRVGIGGVDVTVLEPWARGIGYLPQDFALFPHKSVEENVAFGLVVRRQPAQVIRERVGEMMGLVGIAHLARRRPGGLSGGEKQRVALARALVTQPQVLLLDEPVSAVDEQSRDLLCEELKRLHVATGTTTVHVCHNFPEMLAVADRVAVIHQGRIVQIGTPLDVLERPVDRFVADFVQARNIFEATARSEDGVTRLACGLREAQASLTQPAPAGAGLVCVSSEQATGEVVFIVRPENVSVHRQAPEGQGHENVLPGTVRDIADLGALVGVTVVCTSGHEFQACLGKARYRELRPEAGERVLLSFAADDVHILPG